MTSLTSTGSLDPGKQYRKQTGVPIVPALDGLRWIALALVMIGHVWTAYGTMPFRGTVFAGAVSWGLAPIDLFFIISGFVMFLPTAARGEFGSVRSFAIRRLARMIPAYWTSIALVIALFPLLVETGGSWFSNFGGAAVLAHLSFLQTEVLLFPSLATRSPLGFGINGAVWTLSVEACFYLVLPFVALRFYRRPLTLLVAALGLSALYLLELTPLSHAWLHLQHVPATAANVSACRYILSIQFPAYAGHFAIGMFCALAVVRLSRRPLGHWQSRTALAVALAAIAFLAVDLTSKPLDAGTLQLYHMSALTETLVPLVLGMLVLGVSLAPSWAQRPLSNRVMVRLGETSYGTYVYHLPIIYFAIATLGLKTSQSGGSFVLFLAFVFATSVAAGWLSYVVVESPIRRRAQQLARSAASRRPLNLVSARS